ncbi:SGNH/GDSL hydrolase family protein [Colwellia piezophila]|uniref:SGNH/GDSL hydrolase family protein n=1 Tax=Colwellia piezophila TaxID=211668 RepID=UPI00036E65F7|nr:SGNH/GDSL hydrolase family protein [Colwellia piezophila]
MMNKALISEAVISKKRIYQLIALAIPFAFFGLVEGGLRLVDYGREIPLFIDYPQADNSTAPQYLLPRPDVVKRYFPEGSSAPSVTIETNFFLKEKPKKALRIVVQGGSTAAGFPFGYGASIAGMLDYRLKQSFPDRTVEVINTALAAVNSYTVLDFVDEIIEQQPDAVLIYAGHNEYLGILGVGSAYTAANSPAATLLYLKLKNSRIFQLLQNLYW